MDVLDPGHNYKLNCLDGDAFIELRFVKRKGKKYPGNKTCYCGTNIQEVLRAVIDRCRYLDNQVPCDETKEVISLMRHAIIQLELRAAVRHGRDTHFLVTADLENGETCSECGHLGCGGSCE